MNDAGAERLLDDTEHVTITRVGMRQAGVFSRSWRRVPVCSPVLYPLKKQQERKPGWVYCMCLVVFLQVMVVAPLPIVALGVDWRARLGIANATTALLTCQPLLDRAVGLLAECKPLLQNATEQMEAILQYIH